jgi:hypothetical protein
LKQGSSRDRNRTWQKKKKVTPVKQRILFELTFLISVVEETQVETIQEQQLVEKRGSHHGMKLQVDISHHQLQRILVHGKQKHPVRLGLHQQSRLLRKNMKIHFWIIQLALVVVL